MCEFYLHNLVFPYNSEWNPLLYVGDLQVRALCSYMHNEDNKGDYAKRYKEMEKFAVLEL